MQSKHIALIVCFVIACIFVSNIVSKIVDLKKHQAQLNAMVEQSRAFTQQMECAIRLKALNRRP